MDRIKRYAEEILEKYRNLFSGDFEKNKEAIATVSVIQSKWLKNRIAGYITLEIRRESEEAEAGSEEVLQTVQATEP